MGRKHVRHEFVHLFAAVNVHDIFLDPVMRFQRPPTANGCHCANGSAVVIPRCTSKWPVDKLDYLTDGAYFSAQLRNCFSAAHERILSSLTANRQCRMLTSLSGMRKFLYYSNNNNV